MAATEETGLSVLDNSQFLALRPSGDIAEALAANLATGDTITEADLTRVKVPSGGSTKWTVPDLSGEQVLDELVGCLVYYAPRAILWSSLETSNKLPVLISDDLKTAHKVGDDIGDLDPKILDAMLIKDGSGLYDWRGTDEHGPNKYNDWGTGKNGIGKRAKELRVMCLLRPNDAFPLLLNAPPGSLRTIVPFVKKLRVPFFRAIVSLKLSKEKSRGGQEYAQIVPTLAGEISKAEGEAIRRLYTDPLRKVVTAMVPTPTDETEE